MRSSPRRRCTARLSSSIRRAVSKSPWMSARIAIMVCAFARAAGEPEPSASSVFQALAALLLVAPQLPEAPERRSRS